MVRSFRHALFTARPSRLACLAALLCLPSLGVGLVLDDLWIFRELDDGSTPLLPRLLDAFEFASPGPPVHAAQEAGCLAWWALPELKLRFLRPLAALSHTLDLTLFPHAPWLMHTVSIAWLCALVLAACAWFRRLFPASREVVGVASALYALAPGHVFAASWLANRSACISGVFGLLALISHDRARRERSRLATWLTPLALLLSLLASESGLSSAGLLLGHALFLDESPRPQRALALLPSACVIVGWAYFYAYVFAGGAHGSDLYFDPLHDTARLLQVAPARLLVLIFSQWFLPISAFSVLLSQRAFGVLALCAGLCLVWVALSLAQLLRSNRKARFGLGAGILSLLPVLFTVPHDRLLIIPDLAMLGLLSQWAVAEESALASKQVRRALVIARVWLSIPLALGYSSSLRSFVALEAAPFEHMLREPEVEKATLVFVHAPSYFTGFMPLRRMREGGPVPRRIRVLAPAIYPAEVWREDSHTLVMRHDRGFLQPQGTLDLEGGEINPWLSPAYLPQALDAGQRGRDHPMTVGTVLKLSDITIRVREVNAAGLPVEIAFHFVLPLDHPTLRFLRWKDQGYAPFALPRAGERVLLPAVRG